MSSMPVYRVDAVAGEDGRSLGPHSSHGSTRRRRPPPDPLRAALRKSTKRRAEGGAASLRPDPGPITKGEGGEHGENSESTSLHASASYETRMHAVAFEWVVSLGHVGRNQFAIAALAANSSEIRMQSLLNGRMDRPSACECSKRDRTRVGNRRSAPPVRRSAPPMPKTGAAGLAALLQRCTRGVGGW